MPTLRIKSPDGAETTHVLTGDRITLGRRPDNIIQLLDRSVSGYHAELIWEGDHYRLHDLGSTNFCFVEGQQITDFNLRNSCKVGFGNVEGEFDAIATEAPEAEVKLSNADLEKDMAFLRAENQEHLNKIDSLQRRIDILSSARLVTGKHETTNLAAPEQLKKLIGERDELRFQISGLKLELEKVRDELSATQRERDAARQVNELLQAEKAQLQQKLVNADDKSTQKIVIPAAPSPATAPILREEESKKEGLKQAAASAVS